MQRLRIRFTREEEIKYISHLDLMRLWQRALNRAGIAIAYSEGFNPHPRLVIALPLPVGCTGAREVIDVFLDEPLNGIDPVSGRVVMDLLRRLAHRGVTLFFTTHVLDVAERLCDEVAVIDRGRIVAQGTLDEIRTQRALGGDASLEDVFLKLVEADVQREDLSWIG